MRFGRFRMTSKTQRIVLSIAALVIAILIGILQGDEDPRVAVERAQARPGASETKPATAENLAPNPSP